MDYDLRFMERAFDLAVEAEMSGNLPIGAVITDGREILSEGRNGVMSPIFHPGRHAEIDALSGLDERHLPRLAELAMYVTLEPCLMCMGSAVLHRIRTIYFAAHDPDRGASYLFPHIAERYPERHLPSLVGPVLPERGAELFERARRIYRSVRSAG